MESLLVNFDKNKTNKIYFIITTIKFDLKMSQSQHSGSIVSADNAEIKYKKALKEISKLITANRTLRQNHEKQQRDLKEKIDQLSLRYEDLLKQYDTVRKQKQSFAHYLDQIQKQRNNLDREVAYLNDVLAQQNAELKKLNMHKDERAVAALIRTYEDKEATMNRNRNQNQEMIAKLKNAVQRLENDIQQQRSSRQEYQDRYKALSLQMNRYKEQNSSLLDQIERLLRENSQKDTYCVEKQRQLRALITQFQKQISLLRSAQQQSSKYPNKGENQNYEQLLNEKNRMTIELTKLQTAYQQVMSRQKEFYQMEERMKSAKLQADRANEQVNMLKSKIVVLQAKEFLDEAGDDDYDQKQFEERLNLLVSQNDPLNSIKNHDDNSHFRILKAFIVDLQDKIYKINAQKKQTTKKYKSIKVKFVKNAEQLRHYEQQNKIMKGKLEGYERLTQKLQFELERALSNHEQQITRMTITSNNIITKKVDEYKATIGLLNSQLEMNQDKADRTEKNYKQQIQTLKLQLDTLKIKVKDETDKSGKDTELIQLYKNKNSQLSSRISSLEQQLANNNENLAKFQHLFKQQKGKNEGLLSQKQQLLAQTRQLSEQIDKKSSSFSSNFKIKEDQYQFQIKKLKTDNQKLKDQIQYNSRQLISLQKQVEQKRKGDQGQVQQIKRQTQRNVELQSKIAQLRKKIRDLQDENQSIKIKSKKFQQNYDKINRFQQQNIVKNDKINDLTRQKLMLQSQIKNLKNQLSDQKKQSQQYKKELSNMKMKSLQSNHESKRQYEAKIFESKKNNQSLNQDISDLTTELRQQKSKNMKLANQLNIVKAQKDRLQQIIDQNRKKDLQHQSQFGNYKIDLSNAQMQNQRLRSQIKGQQSISNNLNQQIESLQQKIFSLNQQISSLKMKVQSAEDSKNDLVRDLNSLKSNFGSVESQTNQSKSNINLPWPEQNFYSNLSDILSRVKKICRNYGINIESSVASSYQTTSITTSFNSPAYNPTSFTQQTTTLTKNNINQANVAGDDFKQYTKSYTNTYEVPKATANDSTSKGNGYLQYFKSYADTDGNKYETSYSKPFQIGVKDKNFQSNIGTAQSIGIGKFDYNYSQSNVGSSEGINNPSSYGNADYWKQPAYDYGQGGKSNYEFNFSALSNLSE